ncbi:MAG: DUF1552 domain-containing protein [Acidobacteriota bacterium]|nr:DUF1552 domain-containing protein [Acidobacteriota bacterium]
MFKPISRRTLLRGAGAAVALPWLETMSRAASPALSAQLAEPPMRMAFMFMPNGVRPDLWDLAGEGETITELSRHLKPLEPYKNDILVLENLWHKKTVGRSGHWVKVPAWLSGGFVERTSGQDLNTGGTSVDQVAAGQIGGRTALPTFELGIEAPRTGVDNAGGGFARMYGSFISWRDPHTPVVKEIVPQMAFDRLFGNGSGGPVIESLQRDRTSVLDLVMGETNAVRRQASALDQVKLDEYFESVRSVEKRMEAALKPQLRWINQGKAPVERPGPGIPQQHAEHVKLMLDIMVLAFWNDSTRISSFMFGDAQSGMDFSFLPGVHGGFHGNSHHLKEPGKMEQYAKIVDWHMEQVAYFLGRVKSLDEGGTSMLDNSMFLFGCSIKDGNAHEPENLPLILAGKAKGTLRPGRRVRAEAKTPLCNLHLAMLNRMGVMDKSFGDSTEPLKGLS